MDRLPYEPKSIWRAEQAGGMAHFGWGTEAYLLATVGDLIQVNTNVTAAHGSKRKPKRIKPIERPDIVTAAKPETLDAVPWGFFR